MSSMENIPYLIRSTNILINKNEQQVFFSNHITANTTFTIYNSAKTLRSVPAEVSVYIILMNCIKLFLVHSPQSQNPDNVIEVQCRVTLCSIVFYYVHISFPLKNTEKHWNGDRHQAGAQAPAPVAGQQGVRPQLGGVLSWNCKLLLLFLPWTQVQVSSTPNLLSPITALSLSVVSLIVIWFARVVKMSLAQVHSLSLYWT